MPGEGNPLRARARVLIVPFVFLSLVSGALGQFVPRPPPRPPDFDLIVSYVTVTASRGAAPRLSAKNFQIFEDNKEQKIDYFAVQDQPATVGILWGAGTDAEPDVRECPRDFMKNMVPGSEYFVLSSDTVTTPFTTDIAKMPRLYALSGANSDTAFIGLDVLKESANSRKMLLIVTTPLGGSGGQLDPDYVERAAIKQGYQVHVLAFDSGGGSVNHEGQIFLSELSDLTGGSFTLTVPSNVICGQISRELTLQYMIGYHPTNSVKDGKWRKLSVRIDAPENGVRLKARIRRGYYAEKEAR